MKSLKLISAVSGLIAIGLLTAAGQSESTTTTTTSTYVPTTTIVGSHVTGPQGDEIGQITDVVLDQQTGCMAYVVLSTQAGGAPKTVAAPWTVFSRGSDSHTYTVSVAKEKIYSAPVWESSRIEEYNRADFIGGVYSYYGVQPGVGVNVDIRSHSGDEGQRRRGDQEANPRRNGGRNADMRMQRDRGRNGRNQRRGAETTATPATSETPGSEESNPTTSPNDPSQEGASVTPSENDTSTPRERGNSEERTQSPKADRTAATATPDANASPDRIKRDRGEKREPASEAQPETSPSP